MKQLSRGLCVAIVTCLLAGCSDGGGEAVSTPENPQAGLDAIKKMQPLPDPKAAAKGATSAESKP